MTDFGVAGATLFEELGAQAMRTSGQGVLSMGTVSQGSQRSRPC